MSDDAAMARALARRMPLVSSLANPNNAMASNHSIPAKTLAVLTRQWSALLSAGIPLVQAFELLGQSAVGSVRTRQTLQKILHQLQKDVSAGCALHIAFQKHPRTFDTLYCSLLQAGESAGILDKLLNRLADTLEANKLLKTKIQNALIYPACILAVACGVVMVIMVRVVIIVVGDVDGHVLWGQAFGQQLIHGVVVGLFHTQGDRGEHALGLHVNQQKRNTYIFQNVIFPAHVIFKLGAEEIQLELNQAMNYKIFVNTRD